MMDLSMGVHASLRKQLEQADPDLLRGTVSSFIEVLMRPRSTRLRRTGYGERSLVAVVAECYVAGVFTRRVAGLVQTPGIQGISKSQVSEMAKNLD